mgnify:FL=1
MKYLFLFLTVLCMLLALAPNVEAEELTVPTVPAEAERLMPDSQSDFGAGLLSMLQKALPDAYIEFRQALKTGLAVFSCVFLVSILLSVGCATSAAEIAGAACIAGLMLRDSRVLIGLAIETVVEISEYSKLFLPVMTAAASARGAMTSSAALYVGTSVVTAFLTNTLRRVLVPAIYLFLAASVANCALGEETLKQLRDTIKKLAAWFLKAVLTAFLTYMSITGAVTGTADKTALKAAKAAISTVVPVIGKTLADASEALLLSADIAKNTIGIYGIFAFSGIFLAPFFKIGAHYLVLKGTAALCAIVGCKRLTNLTEDFCTAMGILLGMTGVMCTLSIIGTVCFMKGAG